ncbi:MAG TPA: outer membrane beta-barrel family protein [Agriterribacter sp.]|nr:outer membrane beta-barrel family protein [Agriterribacter sp.]HRQ50649.1 outer membrane beta-barrel family protein [Agriterribacter sp.]
MNTKGDQSLDLLQRIPGVKIDRDGQLSLQGKSGVLIYIDGKQSYLTGSALIAYLKSLPASDIVSIEFITNPPASYDAAGSGGVIDIKLKRRTDNGYSVNSTFHFIPLKKPRSGLSAMLTMKQGKWQGYGQLSLDRSPSYEKIKNYRQASGSTFQQESNQSFTPEGVNGMLGVSYELSKKQVMGLDIRGMEKSGTIKSDGYLVQINSGVPLNVTLKANNSSKERNRALHGFYLLKIDTIGSAFSIDGDYYHYRFNQQDYFTNTFGSVPNYLFKSLQDRFHSTNIYAFKADLIRKTAFAVIQVGVKTSSVVNTSFASIDSLLDASQLPLPGYANSFTYLERIHAGYVSVSKQIKHMEIKTGLRYEQTSGRDRSGQLVQRRYKNIFPSASLNTQLGVHQLALSYRKSIMRPVYTSLNPFVYYSDMYNTVQENPNLNPALAHIGELNYVIKNTRILTVNYVRMYDAVLDVLSYDSMRKINQAQPQSIGTLETWYFATGQALKLTKFWSISTDVAMIYNRIISPTDQGQWSWMAQLSSDLQFQKGWYASLLGKYSSKSIYELSKLFPVGTISFGLKKTIAKGRGFVALDVNDILYSDRNKTIYNYQNIQQETLTKWQSRIIKITLNYTIGNSKVSLTNKRESDIEEEGRLK